MASSLSQTHVGWVSWGANSYGQLCGGDCEDQLLPRPCILPQGVTSVIGGGGHTFFVTGSKLYACGWNSKGQLGLGTSSDPAMTPIQEVTSPQLVSIPPGVTFRTVTAGWDFSFLVDEQGYLYSCGSNIYGQLGLPEVEKSTDTFSRVNIEGKIVSVSCGLRHTVIATADGCVLTCGSGKKGQLGTVGNDQKPPKLLRTFTKVRLPSDCGNVTHVAAGAYHTAALTDSGQVLVWGDNKHGQLASDSAVSSLLVQPAVLDQCLFGEERVKELHTGWTHMLAVTDNDHIMTWGRGDYGQLGRPLPARTDHTPTVIEVPSPPVHIRLGSEHNLLLDASGTLYSWGWNEHGLCATGDETNVLRPAPITAFETRSVTAIGTGMGHSFAYSVEKT